MVHLLKALAPIRLMMRQTPSTPEAYPNSYQCPPGSSCSKVIFPLGPKTASKVSENPKTIYSYVKKFKILVWSRKKMQLLERV